MPGGREEEVVDGLTMTSIIDLGGRGEETGCGDVVSNSCKEEA